MSGPARKLALRSSLVALLVLSLGQHLSSRQTASPASPDRQQNPPPATGMILGQVVDAATGKPVPGAIISFTSGADIIEMQATQAPPVPTRVIADGEGRFVFRNLAKGRYSFLATAYGYLTGGYGQRRAGGPTLPLELETGEKILDAVVRMWKVATISGTVLDEAGEPVVAASVRALRHGIVSGRVRWILSSVGTTDDRGIYRITGLTPGDYTVALLSGTSTMPASTVEAYREAITAGPGASTALTRELQASSAPFPSTSGIRVADQVIQQTGILGGSVTAPAPAEDGRMLAYPTTYHPAATSASQLTVITLASGEDRTAIDLHLRLVPTFSVSGTVTGPEGPSPNMGVRLLPTNIDEFSSESGLEVAVTATDTRGAFTFLGVPAGVYTLKVIKIPRPATPVPSSEGMVMISSGSFGFGTSLTPPSSPPAALPTEPTLWGSLPLSVGDANVTGVNVTLRTGYRVTGRVEFQGNRPAPTPDQIQRMSVTLTPLDSRATGVVTPGRVTPDGQFRTLGFPPGRYLVGAGGAGSDWTLKTATLGGRDVSDEPLEIDGEDIDGVVLVFTDRPTQLSGTVRNSQGQGDADADVVVFPANHQLWKEFVNSRRARSVRTSQTGVFTIQGLPPGDYYLIAIGSTSSRDWQDPKFLEAAAPLATRVTLLDADKKTQELKTTRVR